MLRRSFLAALTAFIAAAPAIVRASSLMPIKVDRDFVRLPSTNRISYITVRGIDQFGRRVTERMIYCDGTVAPTASHLHRQFSEITSIIMTDGDGERTTLTEEAQFERARAYMKELHDIHPLGWGDRVVFDAPVMRSCTALTWPYGQTEPVELS